MRELLVVRRANDDRRSGLSQCRDGSIDGRLRSNIDALSGLIEDENLGEQPKATSEHRLLLISTAEFVHF